MDSKKGLKTFHCVVAVNYNTWINVRASNKEEAEKKAILQSHEKHAGDSISAYNSFSYANVLEIYEDD